MLIDIKVTNVAIFDTLDFSMLGVKSRKEQPDTGKVINGQLLGKVSLIYGANGSGKSTFVRIMSVLKSIVLTETDTITAHSQLAKDKSLPVEVGVNFITNDTEYSYLLEFNSEVILAEALYFRKVPFKGHHVRVFERIWNGERYDLKFGKPLRGICKKYIILHSKQFYGYKSHAFTFSLMVLGYSNNTDMGYVYAWFDNIAIAKKYDSNIFTRNVIKSDKFEPKYMSFLLKSLNFAGMNTSALKFDYDTGKAMAQIGNDTWIPISELSTGEQDYLALMMQVCKARDVIIIDDFGSGLHPRLSKELLKLLHGRLGKQVIATTHDVTLIEAEIRPEQIWFVDKARGKTEMVGLCEYIDAKRCHGRYLVGRYGGVPFINDTAFWGYDAETNQE